MRSIYIAIALSFIVLALILPTPEGLNRQGLIMISILLMAAFLWITEAIPLAATGLLIMALQPLLGIADAKEVFSSFGNKAIFFILASFMISASIEKYGLHKRLALKFLKIFGKNPYVFIFGIMFSGAILSFIMQEHGVAALLLPILLHILILTKAKPKKSNFGIATMLALTYGTSIGSWGTLLGGARNPLTIAFLDEIGYELSFLSWMKFSLPIVFISIPLVTFIILRFFPPEIKNIEDAIREIEKETFQKLGKNEKMLILVISITIISWIFFSDLFGIAVIALLSVISLFLLGLISWEDIEKRVQWGIILVYGGAITMGKSLEATQATQWLVSKIISIFGNNEYAVLACIIVMTFLLTNFMSNTAAVAVMLPISIRAAYQVNLSPVIAAMATAIAGGAAFIFIIATPGMAIAYSSGYLTQKHMVKAGLIAGIACLILIFMIAIIYWPLII